MDDEKTAFVDQEPQYYQQNNPNFQQGYNQQVNPYAQPFYNQQANPYEQTGYNQQTNPYEQQSYYQQPDPYQHPDPYQQPVYGQQTNPYEQPSYNQQTNPYEQPSYNQQTNPYGQTGFNQQGSPYTQPNYNQQTNPYETPVNQKAPKKQSKSGSSKNVIISVVSSVIAIAVLAVFFIVIVPMIRSSKLSGLYEGDEYWILFEDGVYTLGTMDDTYTEVGTYKLSGSKLILKYAGADGEKTVISYKLSGKIEASDDTLNPTDKSEVLPFKPDADYISQIEDKIKAAAEDALSDSEVSDEAAKTGSYTISKNSLANPKTKFEQALADELDYENNEILQYMFEDADTTLNVTVDDSTVTVDVY